MSETALKPDLPDQALLLGPIRNGETRSNALLILSDLLALTVASTVAIFVWHVVNPVFSRLHYFSLVLPFAAWTLTLFGIEGLYPAFVRSPVIELKKLITGTTTSFLLAISATFLSKESSSYSRGIVSVAFMLSVVLLLLFRAGVRTWFGHRDWWGVPAVLIGKAIQASQIGDLVEARASMGIRIIAALDDHRSNEEEFLPFYPLSALESMPAVGCAIVMMHGWSKHEFEQVSAAASRHFQRLIIIPDLADIASVWVTSHAFGGLLGLEVNRNLQEPWSVAVKRLFDLFLTLLVGVPALLLSVLIYAAVRLSSPGPALYSHERIGTHGKVFRAWKFRTMYINADEAFINALKVDPDLHFEWKLNHKVKDDPRITPIGKILRKSSLDELPQLWNVLIGEMSLVGPRPIVSSEITKYGKTYESYKMVRPGLTGFWQISGRNDTTYEKRVSCDEYYIRNWSVWFDLYILLRTIKAVVSAKGAY